MTLKIEDVYGSLLLGKGVYKEEGVNFRLSIKAIEKNNPECKNYKGKKRLEMNAVDVALPEMSNLDAGKILEGSLNYHRPSPFGKTLFEAYHHGFQIKKILDGSEVLEDYSDQYVYFRHIGVFDK